MSPDFDKFAGDAADEFVTQTQTPEDQAALRGLRANENGIDKSAAKDEPEELRSEWLRGWNLGKELEV